MRVVLEKTRLNILLWGVIALLMFCIFGGNYYFSDQRFIYRLLGACVLGVSTVFLMFQTVQGKKLWSLWQESIQEVRKMYWPTRQETLYTTLAVLGMVFVMALLLWLLDSVLFLGINKWLVYH